MTFIQKAYPDQTKPLCSMIGEFLIDQLSSEALEAYGLSPCEIKVQALERTFIDKVFALCDYYLAGEVTRHSRHIYDIHQLMGAVDWKNQTALIHEVRNDRKSNKTCLSAQDNISVSSILQQIIDSEYYRKDYEEVTEALLSESIDYRTAVQSVMEIADSRIFDA